MDLDIKLFDGRFSTVSNFVLEDFRHISMIVENSNDKQLEDYLLSKIKTPCNCIEAFYSLLGARMAFVNDMVSYGTGDNKSVNINLNLWVKSLKDGYLEIKKDIEIDNFKISLDYPSKFLYEDFDTMFLDCIYRISLLGKSIDFQELSLSQKVEILDKIPMHIIKECKSYITDNVYNEIVLMEETSVIPKISISAGTPDIFILLRSLFNYYRYDDILEMIFQLSKRITDVTYLNSRSPRDIDFLISLYSEEVEKINKQDN